MLLPAVDLDANMPCGAVLARLALNGFWLDARHGPARQRIEDVSHRLQRPFDEVAKALACDPSSCGAAIRHQWGMNVLWYARGLPEVLRACESMVYDTPLIDALNLHEGDARPPIEASDGGGFALRDGVVMERGQPVAVSLGVGDSFVEAPRYPAAVDITLRGEAPRSLPSPPLPPKGDLVSPQVWPRIDAPNVQPAGTAFDVIVGFGGTPQAQVSDAPMTLPFSDQVLALDLQIELSAGQGLTAVDGWSRPLRVTMQDIATAAVRFTLVGLEPTNGEGAWLTMLDVRYVLGGTICGTASRPLVITPARRGAQPNPRALGTPWQAMPASATPVALAADTEAPDLTIEISKPDRAPAAGSYVCRLISPHTLAALAGPFDIDLGQDARTFAKAIVEEVRLYENNALLANAMESIGRLIAGRLPRQVFDALAEVAIQVAPAAPAVLIVSDEPYVPWELAWLATPLDVARPSYLGAQALVGRWLRDTGPAPTAPSAVARPAAHPIAALSVRDMAVMAAWYKASTGLRRLPKAEAEADTLSKSFAGVPLRATPEALRDLLNGTVQGDMGPLTVDCVHFAGHGDFDPTRPDASALFLEDGTPLRSTLFRTARYGGARQPLLFLNACMLGIGGELLGDMGGFPGNSLRGGFGGVLGALWEVDDEVAHDVAIEFWRRALPASPAAGEPVGAILRELRARYSGAAGSAPVATYLAYVYYGHPRLRLQRTA